MYVCMQLRMLVVVGISVYVNTPYVPFLVSDRWVYDTDILQQQTKVWLLIAYVYS